MFVSNPLFRERQRRRERIGSQWRAVGAADGHNLTAGKDVFFIIYIIICVMYITCLTDTHLVHYKIMLKTMLPSIPVCKVRKEIIETGLHCLSHFLNCFLILKL